MQFTTILLIVLSAISLLALWLCANKDFDLSEQNGTADRGLHNLEFQYTKFHTKHAVSRVAFESHALDLYREGNEHITILFRNEGTLEYIPESLVKALDEAEKEATDVGTRLTPKTVAEFAEEYRNEQWRRKRALERPLKRAKMGAVLMAAIFGVFISSAITEILSDLKSAGNNASQSCCCPSQEPTSVPPEIPSSPYLIKTKG